MMLLLPGFSNTNFRNGLFGNTVFYSSHLMCVDPFYESGSNFQNLFPCQFLSSSSRLIKPPFFSPRRKLAPLFYRIVNVLFLSSYKKMARPHARWVIALVTNFHAFWDRTFEKHPRYSMSAYGAELFKVKVAVAINIESPAPIPTLFGFINPIKKLLFIGHRYYCIASNGVIV